jgi:type IV secretion system protein VirB9
MPYRTTDIRLEPGEQVLEMPFLSEEKVWEIGAGVSRKEGRDVQHFFVKPTYANLTTSMIIITDRRVYHILLKSFKETCMVMVEWEYPPAMPFTVKTEAMNRRVRELANDSLTVSPEFLSFDYKMSYSLFKKPVWIPKRVYDDGRKTYIELDEKMLHTESPVIFNRRNERINYRVSINLAIIDGLIEKITVRRGKEKVVITKKKYRAPVAVSEPESAAPEEQQGE